VVTRGEYAEGGTWSLVTRSFAHLHTHTEFSMLDGAARVDDLVQAAVADGQPALGITDHGNMYGVLDFYAACREAGINPVIGTEAYMAAESRHERPVRRGKVDDTGGDVAGGEKLYYHLTLLAESTEGYRNLLKLSSAAYLEGYYYKPRLDWELLERHSTGLIATTGCLGGVVLQSLLADDPIRAEALAARLQDIFGKDNLFVELQDHGLPEQHKTNPALVDIARRIGAPLLATNDSHYTHREDHVVQDALLCVQTGALIDDPKRFKFEGDEHYLKSAAEMRHLFAEVPEACDNTLLIAERAAVEIDFGRTSLPRFPVPSEFGGATYEECAAGYLRHLSVEGAKERYGHPVPAEVMARLDYELGVIADMGFSAYFLVVWDLIRFARSRGIRVGPGRGSAAGCCVAYCLQIVDLDPIRYDLLFERFLNPGRVQMPDIDMDFDERYRGDMIKYAADRYGSDHVAQIVTFSTIKARAAVRDAARVLGYPYVVGDKIAKAMPPLLMGRDTPLSACLIRVEGHEDGFAAAGELRAMYDTEPEAKRVIDVATGLEGLRRQDGIHAAAVVITDEPLTEYVPVQRKPDGNNPDDAPIVTQYEMHGVEELGLLKMDFLGLRNLSVIERSLDLIEVSTGGRPDIDGIPLDDPETFAMLCKGDSMGVFQLEGGPMRSLMRSLAPTTFDDVAALVALYRPGPMAANMHRDYADRKNGRQRVSYLHPDLEEILGDTYGLMIYQESVMRVAQKIAGYDLAEADNLRKACGKKNRALIQAEREKFIAGCVATGYDEGLGTALFDIIEPFADYAFNKSHAYGYGFIAYQTAWLKAHHPVEYLASLLTSVKDNKDKTAVYLGECRSMGIEVLVPDVNRSLSEFAADYSAGLGTLGERGESPGAITFGLAAVRNVGEGLVAHIVAERTANGPYADFYDFCQRVDPQVLNKRTIESLIKAGGFDSLGHPRRGLCLVFEEIVDRTLERRREHDAGVVSLFATLEPETAGQATGFADTRTPIPDTEFDKGQRLSFEKEMLGLYLSDHPLMGLETSLARLTDCTVAELRDGDLEGGGGFGGDGQMRQVGGVVTELARRYTKKGDLMATFVLEDLNASIEVFVFPKSMADYGALLDDDAIVVLKGRVDLRDDRLKLVCMEIQRPELSADGNSDLRISLPVNSLTDRTVEDLKRLLVEHPGEAAVLLHIGEKVLRLPPEFNVDSRRGLVGELRVLLGPNAIQTCTAADGRSPA
jgi:DNA polymerase-3 subunit alpha